MGCRWSRVQISPPRPIPRFKMPHLHWRARFAFLYTEGGVETREATTMKARLALNWLIAILTVPALMRGIHEFADGQTDMAVYITLGLWVAGVLCGYALLGAVIGWMERNERRVEADPYAHKGSNYREV